MGRQHVDLIDNENLETIARRRKADRSDNRLANVVHLSVGSGVDLLHVDRAAFGYLTTRRTGQWIVRPAWCCRRSVGFMAIKSLSQKPRGRGFPYAPCAGTDVGMMEPVMLDSVSQSSRDGLLAGDFIESLRSPLTGDYLIGHVVIFDCVAKNSSSFEPTLVCRSSSKASRR